MNRLSANEAAVMRDDKLERTAYATALAYLHSGKEHLWLVSQNKADSDDMMSRIQRWVEKLTSIEDKP